MVLVEAIRQKPHHLVKYPWQIPSVVLAPEDPIKFHETDEPGEVRGRTRRTRSIGRISTSAEWLGSSGPVESVPTG